LSNYEELEKPRRNLLIISCALIFAQVAGIEITAINVPALSINIQRPEYLLPFVWLMLAYTAWRFWLTAQAVRTPFSDRSNAYVNLGPHVLRAMHEQGVAAKSEWLNDNNPMIERALLARIVTIHLPSQDLYGQVTNTPRVFRIGYFRHFFPELVGDLKSIIRDKQFVEYDLPLLVALVPVLIAVWQGLVRFQAYLAG
jgi:hypothetical protein